jgi:flavin reductase (DIM6/NTAB) family NADH-FMN oxidoreductase RutF
VINSDPPLFTVGFAGGFDNAKDSLRNLTESGECVINIISEHFIEAANSTSVNTPYGESEWALSGLTPAPCKTVKASRVQEAIFSVEGKLDFTKEYESKATPGKKTGVLVVIEGTHFWVREDAINKEKNRIDPAVSIILAGCIEETRLTFQ